MGRLAATLVLLDLSVSMDSSRLAVRVATLRAVHRAARYVGMGNTPFLGHLAATLVLPDLSVSMDLSRLAVRGVTPRAVRLAARYVSMASTP